MRQSLVFVWSALAVPTLFVTGCFGRPEQCHGCLAVLTDGSLPEAPRMDAPLGTGGGGAGASPGTGGTLATGGMRSSGGAPTGGTAVGGAATGGAASGGAATGGRGTGGAATGGRGPGGAATGGAGGMGGARIDPDLVLWYPFDNDSDDSAMFGGTARNATLATTGTGSATYSTTRQVGTGALNLTGTATTGGYATVPNIQSQIPAAVTIACWVNVRSDQVWQRVFDFGTMAATPVIYMFLTTNQGMTTPSSVRFTMSTTGNAMEQVIDMATPATLPLNTWHHVAVVLPAGSTYTGTLYIDRVVAGSTAGMTLHPTSIAMPNSFIGRSQWTNDPYFNGYVDDFRIYRRALTAAEIAALP